MSDGGSPEPSAPALAGNEHYARAAKVLPGGYGRSTFAAVGPDSPYVRRGEGHRLWDHTGRELVDLNNNFTVLVHGHAHPEVTAAAQRAVADGTSFGLPHESEIEHAEALLARLPGADRVRYANSGSEAVMLAIRVARAATGRRRVLFIRSAYHGTADVALVSGGEHSQRGIPAAVIDDVSLAPINDLDALTALVGSEPESVAAVVLDLLPNRAGLIPLEPDFVTATAALCRRHGILLVADEVISFRLAAHGLAAEYGIEPDLVTLGKLIGGGFPVGAVAGRADVMEELDPLSERGLEHGGTFSGNPVTMSAGRVALDLFDAAEIARLNALGDDARADLGARLEPLGWEVRGRGSLLRPFRVGATREEQRDAQRALWWAAYDGGVVLTQNCLAALSTPMDADLVGDAVARLEAAVEKVEERAR